MTEPFGRSIFGHSVKGTWLLAFIASAAFPFYGRADNIPGLWAAVLWISANVWMIHRILDWTARPQSQHRNKVFVLALVKFPVLYLAGFFILMTEWVTLEGVFWAFTVFFVSAGAGLTFRRLRKSKVA